MMAAGGTGGHIYPALAVAEAVVHSQPQSELVFVGSSGLEREIVPQAGIVFAAYHDVQAGPIAGVSMGRRLASLLRFAVGTAQAAGLIGRYRPQALLLTGGWSGLPTALAAWLRRVPVLIFLPDVEPGAMIRLAQRFARCVALTVPESARYFPPGKTTVTGYPLRRVVTQATRAAAIAHFGLDSARQTLLVFGGSRGARSINRALLAVLPQLMADGVQVIHISGTLDWPEVEARRAALDNATRYHAFPYLHHEMGLALAAADVVVSRAGASTLAEFPLFGLPSILVPYPHAWRYQKVNADYLAQRGAALVIEDEQMPDELLPAIRDLLADPARLAQMRACAAALAQPDGAGRIAAELARLAGEGA
jgi:undecaprenyldiphospho-muramoylpentapeptide beta-N-acetylglucosaminyltransferase